MNNSAPKLLIWLPAVGFLSGLITIAFMANAMRWIWPGCVFGILIVFSLSISGIVNRLWEAIWFVVASTVGHILSVIVAFTVQLKSPPNWLLIPSFEQRSMGYAQPDSPVALFVGGLVGGLLVLIGLSVQMRHENGTLKAASTCLCWSWTGGVFALLGWGLQNSLGVFIWHFLHSLGLLGTTWSPHDELMGMGEIGLLCSLYTVWQTGMAFVLAMLRQKYPQGLSQI